MKTEKQTYGRKSDSVQKSIKLINLLARLVRKKTKLPVSGMKEGILHHSYYSY